MIVKANIAPTDLWKLVVIAERQGFGSVGEMFEAIAARMLTSPPKPPVVRRPSREGTRLPVYDQAELKTMIRELHGHGSMSDAQMAAEIGCSPETVRHYRNQMKLPPTGRAGRRNKASQDSA